MEKKTKSSISKSEVQEILYEGDFECLCMTPRDNDWLPYEGCFHNLLLILHDGSTKVKIARNGSSEFLEGYQTIIMDAPIFPAKILIRTELSEDC